MNNGVDIEIQFGVARPIQCTILIAGGQEMDYTSQHLSIATYPGPLPISGNFPGDFLKMIRKTSRINDIGNLRSQQTNFKIARSVRVSKRQWLKKDH